VVVNPGNPVTNISLADLRKMFAGEKHTWPRGVPVKPVVRAPGCHERLALLRLLNMSEGEYKQHWTAIVLRGEADAEPPAVFSVGMQKEAIAAFPGVISLVDAHDVMPGMKVIKLDGLAPGAPGYLLQ